MDTDHMTETQVGSRILCVRTDWLRSCMSAWEQWRQGHTPLGSQGFRAKIREIVNGIVPFDPDDDWGRERMARVMFSRLGRRKGRKAQPVLPLTPMPIWVGQPAAVSGDTQLLLPFME